MKHALKHARLAAGAGALLFVSLAALLLHALPSPHQPLHYVVAGTAATTGSLIAAF